MPMAKYDDFDYHVGSAVEAGQPPENAFTHIGFMLGWLARRGFVDPAVVPAEVVGGLESGDFRPNDLRDLVDGQLIDDMLTAEANRFLAAYYESYLREYNDAFSDWPEYAVPDDRESFERASGVIDSAYARWLKAGRPAPGEPSALWPIEPPPDLPVDLSNIEMQWEYSGPEDLLAGIPIPEGVEIARVEPTREHVDPALEDRIATAADAPLETDSTTASHWSSSLLDRLIRRLGLSRREVIVATANGNGPHGDPWINVQRFPGIETSRLFDELRPDRNPTEMPGWHGWAVGSIVGMSCVQTFEALPPQVGFWFVAGSCSVYVSGASSPESLERLAIALHEALRH